MKNLRLYLILIITIALTMLLPACDRSSNEQIEPEITSKITLNKTEIVLEKYEFDFLVAEVENAENETISWFTNDPAIATVENGKVSAISKGKVVVGAKLGDGSIAKCFVIVNDNNLVPNLVVNLDEQTNLMVGSVFNVEYALKYNGKVLDGVNFSFSIISEDNAIVLENDVISANAIGDAVLSVRATWGDVVVYDEFLITVDNGIMGKIYDTASVELCNDARGNLPVSATLNPIMYEDGNLVEKENVIIENISSDLDIITFEDGDKIVAKKQGVTEVCVLLKNLLTGNSVECNLSVKVSLYEQDKSDTITLSKLFHDDESYEITPAKVFKDLEEHDVKDEKIVSVTDVTDIVNVDISHEDGYVDVEQVVGLQLLGERVWKIETERLSYLVKINIEEKNPSSLIFGDYIPESSDYILSLKYLNNSNVVEFYDATTKNLVSSGSYTIRLANESCGLISFSMEEPVYGLKALNGFFWEYNGGIYLDINNEGTNYRSFSLKTNAPYETISGVYSSSRWTVQVALNQDKTFVLDVDNIANNKTLGNYELIATSAYGGNITIQLEKEFAGQKTISGTYLLNNGKYEIRFTDLSIFPSGITMSQKVETINFKNDFAGYYYVKSNLFAPIKLNKDGSCFFAFPKWANDQHFLASVGYYVVEPDNNIEGAGTIKIYLEKVYNNNVVIQGEYVLQNGQYVITSTISGSGNGDVQKFTQRSAN